MGAVPDERAVWIHQYLRIRSSQNLVDVDTETDTDMDMGHVGTRAGKGGGVGIGSGADHSRTRGGSAAAAPAAEKEEEEAAVAVTAGAARATGATSAVIAAEAAAVPQRHGDGKCSGTLASPTTRDSTTKRRTNNRMLAPRRTRTKEARTGEPNKTRRKVRVKAFEVRIEEYMEECRHVRAASSFSGPSPGRSSLPELTHTIWAGSTSAACCVGS